MSKKNSAKAGVLGAIVGALAGIFLLAPKGAKENRKDVKDAVVKGRADAEKKLKEVYSQLADVADDVKLRTKGFSASAKKESEDLVKQADKLKQKIKEMIANVKDDTSDIASDIDGAIKEARQVANKLKDIAKSEAKEAASNAKNKS